MSAETSPTDRTGNDSTAPPGGERRRLPLREAALLPARTSARARVLLDEAERLIGVDPLRMERVCRNALALAERAGDRYLWAMARFKLGESCALQTRNEDARTYLDEAQGVFLQIDRPVEAARTRIIWIWATANLGGDADALRAARAARRVLQRNGQTLYLGTLDLNIGILHCMRGRHQIGVRFFRSALALYESLGQEQRVKRARHNLGLALSRIGRYKEGLIELERARDSAQQAGETRGFAMYTRSIGETYMRLGRYTAALRAFEEAKSAFDSLAMADGTVVMARDLADCYLRLNRPTDALQVLDAAVQEAGRIDTTTLPFELASRRIAALLQLGEREQALAMVEELDRPGARSLADDAAWLAVRHADLLTASGRPERALAAARRSTEIARNASLHPIVADALLAEARAFLASGNTRDAAQSVGVARRLARAQDAAPLLMRAFELEGQIAEAEGRSTVACRRYVASIEQFEREQRGVIFEFRDAFAVRRTTSYERLTLLQLEAGRARDALATAERAKSRALADSITGSITVRPRGTAMARRLTRELAAAREAYAAAHTGLVVEPAAEPGDRIERGGRIRELEERIAGLLRRLQLSADADEFVDVLGGAPSGRLPEIAPGARLLEFYVSGEQILRFEVDGHTVRGRVLSATIKEIDRLVLTFRLSLNAATRSNGDPATATDGRTRAVLTRLHEILLDGVSLDERCHALLVVPHGPLHYVPFHALHDGRGYLVERMAVSYAPSAALFAVCQARGRRRRLGSPLVLANSLGGTLPHAQQEAAGVAAVLNVEPGLESEATRATVAERGRRAEIIHLVAHGEFRPDAPLFSHIQLADGPLTTADVYNLDLRAGLVTLSACETGRAVLGGGDELVGLARAFLYAGAAGLLVSQWRVADDSTAALMTRFYEALKQGVGPAEALRMAQRSFVDDAVSGAGRAHPFFWAGFQLIGGALPYRPAPRNRAHRSASGRQGRALATADRN